MEVKRIGANCPENLWFGLTINLFDDLHNSDNPENPIHYKEDYPQKSTLEPPAWPFSCLAWFHNPKNLLLSNQLCYGKQHVINSLMWSHVWNNLSYILYPFCVAFRPFFLYSMHSKLQGVLDVGLIGSVGHGYRSDRRCKRLKYLLYRIGAKKLWMARGMRDNKEKQSETMLVPSKRLVFV